MPNVLNIIMTATRTPPGENSRFLNMTMMTNSPEINDLYIEFSNVDFSDVIDIPMGKEIYNSLRYKSYNRIDTTLEDNNLRLFKGSDSEISELIRSYLGHIIDNKGKQIVFWISDITIWEKFMLNFFGRDEKGLIEFPSDDISMTPVSIDTIFRLPVIDSNAEKRSIKDAIELLEIKPSILINSLSEATYYYTLLREHSWFND